MSGADLNEILYIISYGAIPFVFAVTVHEVAHGWSAKQLGDNTASQLGRLTLNPIRHIDPFGSILLPLMLVLSSSGVIFGSAKPVPVNAARLRNPKWHMPIVAIAGPAVNILMACGWALLAFIQVVLVLRAGLGSQWLWNMAQVGIKFNVLLAIFNMLPIPPLDGSRIVRPFLPNWIGARFDQVERFGIFIVLGLIMLEVSGVIQFLGALVLPSYQFIVNLFESFIRLGGI